MAMAVKLFEMKRLSSGMAATLAGLNRVNFLLNLHLRKLEALILKNINE